MVPAIRKRIRHRKLAASMAVVCCKGGPLEFIINSFNLFDHIMVVLLFSVNAKVIAPSSQNTRRETAE